METGLLLREIIVYAVQLKNHVELEVVHVHHLLGRLESLAEDLASPLVPLHDLARLLCDILLKSAQQRQKQVLHPRFNFFLGLCDPHRDHREYEFRRQLGHHSPVQPDLLNQLSELPDGAVAVLDTAHKRVYGPLQRVGHNGLQLSERLLSSLNFA